MAPKPRGNGHPYFATNDCYQTRDDLLMLGGGNIAQQRRAWEAVGRPEMAKTDNEARAADRTRESAVLSEILATQTSKHWESVFHRFRVPASRVRNMAELLADPQVAARRTVQRWDRLPGVEGGVDVPTAAFKMSSGGPQLTSPPPRTGADTEFVLKSIG